jgi:hypothetical protein
MHEAWRSPEQMGDLSERDVEDVLEGVQPPGRDDLAHVVELTTWLHVSGEIEPPPAMRDDLFCQIEDGPAAYRRSSRRSPAHLGRPRRVGMRRARATLAASGRPIASVAAAAVLLVGVTLAVRGGGPGREPSAFVSRSAEGLPTAGGDAPSSPSTSTTLASATTAPPEVAAPADPPPTTATSLDRDEPSATPAPTTADESTAPDTPAVTNPPPRALDMPQPTDANSPDAADDGDVGAKSVDGSGGLDAGAPQSGFTDETKRLTLPLSGWSFDLSDWPLAKELWAALGEAEDREDAVDPDAEEERVDPGDDARGRDDDASGGDREHGRSWDGHNEPQDGADPDPGGGRAG